MKAISQKITLAQNRIFEIRKDTLPHFHNSWHFHEEIELTLILKSNGRRFIGDHIDQFNAGDLVLIGPNLPHLWQNGEEYYSEKSDLTVKAIIIHFSPKIWGDNFLNLEEVVAIKELLKKAKFGIKLEGHFKKEISQRIKKLIDLEGFERMISFFKILNDLAKNREYELLASSGFVNSFKKSTDLRLDTVYEYVMEHLTDKVDLSEAASLLNLSDSAFCRFFKSKTRKTFSYFVKEVRIGYACQLLQNNELLTNQICYECGFESYSYFNRSFKSFTGMTPTMYRKSFNFRDG